MLCVCDPGAISFTAAPGNPSAFVSRALAVRFPLPDHLGSSACTNWVSGPPSGYPSAGACSVWCSMDGVMLPCSDGNATLGVVPLGRHNFTVFVDANDGQSSLSFSHVWSTVPLFAELVAVGGDDGYARVLRRPSPNGAVSGRLAVALLEGSNVTLALTLSTSPDHDESVMLRFVVNDTSAVSVHPSLLRFSQSSNLTAVVVVAGTADFANNEQLDTPFTISCEVSSTKDGSAFSSLAVRNVSGFTRNVVLPVLGNVWLWDRVRHQWQSALDDDSDHFSLSVSTNEVMVLVGDTTFRAQHGPHFGTGARVLLGDVPAQVVNGSYSRLGEFQGGTVVLKARSGYVKTGGLGGRVAGWNSESNLTLAAATSGWPPVNTSTSDMIKIISPRYMDACPDDGSCAGNNAYKVLTVRNDDGDAFEGGVGGGEVSCPPHCPGWHTDAPGVYYTEACAGYPRGAMCMEAETASQCAYGKGDSCRPCPPGALCPGGERMWCVTNLSLVVFSRRTCVQHCHRCFCCAVAGPSPGTGFGRRVTAAAWCRAAYHPHSVAKAGTARRHGRYVVRVLTGNRMDAPPAHVDTTKRWRSACRVPQRKVHKCGPWSSLGSWSRPSSL